MGPVLSGGPLWALVLALLVIISGSPSDAILTNSFCASFANITIPNVGAPPTAVYLLSQLCLRFNNASQFSLLLTGYESVSGGPTYISLGTTTCNGTYYWAAPETVGFTYVINGPTSSFCTSDSTSGRDFCPWGCQRFAGSYVPYWDDLVAPAKMGILPGPDLPQYNWGGLAYPIGLACNTSSCGTAVGLIPQLQANVNYTVRRQLSPSEERECAREKKTASAAAAGDDSYFGVCCGDVCYHCRNSGCVEV